MAEPNPSQHVNRGGKNGGLNKLADYEVTNTGDFHGWMSVESDAGAVGKTLEDGDHFNSAMHTGNSGHPQPTEQA